MPAQVAFTTGAPSASPTIAVNLVQPGPVKVLADSFTLGAPDWQGDPLTGLGVLGTRQVELTVQVTGTYQQAAALAQSISRLIGQPQRTWLMFRWSPADDPMFALVYPSQTQPLEWRSGGVEVWNLPITLTCDAALHGPAESGSVTINNDPAHATNPCFWAIGSSVKGDLETPLFLTVGPETTLSSRVFLVASSAKRYGLTQPSPYIVQLPVASGWTPGGGVTTITGDAAMSGGNAWRWTAPSTSAATVQVGANSGSGVLAGNPIGDYRVLLRYRASNTLTRTYSALLIVQDSTGSFTIQGDARPFDPSQAPIGWVDLGVWRFPLGSPRSDPVFGTTPTSAATRVVVLVNVGAGGAVSDTFDFDCLMFVPAGLDLSAAETQAFVDVPSAVGSANASLVLDGPNDAAYLKTSGGAVGSMPFTSIVGGLPTVAPGCDNSLTLLRTVEDGVDTLTASTSLNWQYWPRYLHARPSGS